MSGSFSSMQNLRLWAFWVLFAAASPHCSGENHTTHQSPDRDLALCATGSATLEPIVSAWNAEFRARQNARTPGAADAVYPDYRPRGNGTVASDLGRRACPLGLLTRKMSPHELSHARRLNVRPVAIPIAVNAIVLYAHKSRPGDRITMDQIQKVFTAPENSRPLGINSASEEYRWFKESILEGQDFTDLIREQPDTTSVIENIVSPGDIGYGRFVPTLPTGVIALDVATNPEGPYIAPTPESIQEGTYALHHYVYLYTDPQMLQKATEKSPELIDWIRLILSKEGQRFFPMHGKFALNEEDRTRSRKQLENLLTGKAP